VMGIVGPAALSSCAERLAGIGSGYRAHYNPLKLFSGSGWSGSFHYLFIGGLLVPPPDKFSVTDPDHPDPPGPSIDFVGLFLRCRPGPYPDPELADQDPITRFGPIRGCCADTDVRAGRCFVAAYAGAVLAEAHAGEGAHNPVLIRLRPARLFHTQRLFEDFRDGHTLVLCCDVFEIVVDRPVPGITLISDRRSDFGLTTSSAQFVHKQRWQVCP